MNYCVLSCLEISCKSPCRICVIWKSKLAAHSIARRPVVAYILQIKDTAYPVESFFVENLGSVKREPNLLRDNVWLPFPLQN